MRRWVAVLVFAIAACTQAPSNSVGSASQVPSSTPGQDLPLAKVDFACRLPVTRSATFGNYKGGFITFPAASYAPDPNGVITSNNQGVQTTAARPALSGSPSFAASPFYDAAQQRWVPVSPSQSTPDGSFYAYATFDPSTSSRAHVHVVNVAHATEKVFDVAVPDNAQGFTVTDFDATGVYLLANTFEHLPGGIWLMDSSNGMLREISHVGPVAAVRSSYAWLAAINPTDPSPPQLRRSGTASDSIVRVDLRNGAQATWFYRPGVEVSLLGFDSKGMPIVNASDPSGATNFSETWLTGGPFVPDTRVSASSQPDLISPQGDGDRVWFGSNKGIYLYTRSRGLQKVTAFSDLQVQEMVVPAGVCA